MRRLLLFAFLTASIAAFALQAEVRLTVDTIDARAIGIGTVTDKQQMLDLQQLASGTGNGKINQVWHSSRSLASGASESLDLRGGLTDSFGQALDFAVIRAVAITNTGTTTLTVTGDPAGPVASIFSVATGGVLLPGSASVLLSCPVTGYAAATGTADKLGVSNAAGGTGTYRVIILGNNQ